MTELPCQSRSRLTALVTGDGQPGKCIQLLGDDFTEDAVIDLTFALRARGWVGSECQIRSTRSVSKKSPRRLKIETYGINDGAS